MRYLLAMILLAIGAVPVILEGNGTFLIFAAIVALTLILDKRDWTKGPYERGGTNDDRKRAGQHYRPKRSAGQAD